MIKAVFFDWVGTLAHPEPDRHESIHQAARELGVELPLHKLLRGVLKADMRVSEGAPPWWRKGADEEPFIRWWKALLAEVGVSLSRKEMLGITELVGQRVRDSAWVLYEDVMPTIKQLKQRGLILGLISAHYIGRAGLDPYLDVVVTAKDVGADKPEPPIFLAALEQAAVDAPEVVYVGDQYERDVVGARGVGMNAILIDRYDLFPEVTDCPRITGLTQVIEYL
ncbi:MAG: HAD-IA family hydrolase [Dehalococcoidales bacterium]|nr:HAD-IA family hydrolase [Dehalococcoidales bacterium]